MSDSGTGGRFAAVLQRVYQVLLVAYPKKFRREYGAGMLQVFGDQCREELHRDKAFGGFRLWVGAVLDLMVSAFVEWCRSVRKEVIVGNYRLAGIGLALLLAPLYFVSASLLKYGLGVGFLFDPLEAFLSVAQRHEIFNIVSPFVFFGGLCLALAINAYTLLRMDFGRVNGAIVASIRLELRLVNIAVAALSLSLIAILAGYVILENFAH